MCGMIYPCVPGYYCVPTALVMLTGADPTSVIFPSLNRHAKADGLLDWVAGVHTEQVAIPVLRELGYIVRAYKHKVGVKLFTWSDRSLRYPDRPLLVTVPGHALVIENGKVYDTHTPHGVDGRNHPYAHSVVDYCWLIQKERL